MKKRILSLFLVAVMVLSTFAIVPVTATADTWDNGENVISTLADMKKFEAAVEGGNTFSGATVTLAADIILPSDWDGIGYCEQTEFCGTFNGQGHTITMGGHTGRVEYGALFNQLGDGAWVTNFKLDGDFILADTTYSSYQAVVAIWARGTVKITDVICSVDISTVSGENKINRMAAILCSVNKTNSNITIENCVYDGTMKLVASESVVDVGTFIGRVYNTDKTCTINITNCVYAGEMILDTPKVDDVGLFVGATEDRSTLTINIKDCLAVGKMTFSARCTTGMDCIGTILGWTHANCTVNVENVYYRNTKIPTDNSDLGITTSRGGGRWPDKVENVVAKTEEDFLNLTAETLGFSSNAWSFKENEGDIKYYPCPTAVVPADGTWLRGLTVGLPDEPDLVINSVEDLLEFDETVASGYTYPGKLIVLNADITLPADWDGIGEYDTKPFKGIFDGQGHTITMSGHTSSGTNGALFSMVEAATIKNLTLDGSAVWGSENFQAGLVNCAAGNTTIENVRVSLNITTSSQRISYAGGFVGFHRNSSSGTLTIDGCVFDGKITCKAQTKYVAAFLGYSGNIFSSGVTKNMVIKNCVYAGNMNFFDHDQTLKNAIFMGYVLGNTNGTVVATVQDCVSIGSVLFPSTEAYDSTDPNAIAFGNYDASYTSLTVENLYYVKQMNSQKSGSLLITYDGAGYTEKGTVKEMTKEAIAALTSADFTADNKLSFKHSDFDAYYPCPTSLLPEEGWLDCLFEAICDAKVIGAQIRYTDPADRYSGIRFVARFKNEGLTGGSADANFGLLLISLENYENATATNSVEALLAAGAIQVPAIKVNDSVEGVAEITAVVYNITAAHYTDSLVAIPYVEDAIVGDALSRSIFQVATSCVADPDATSAQKTFSQGIIDAVNAAG